MYRMILSPTAAPVFGDAVDDGSGGHVSPARPAPFGHSHSPQPTSLPFARTAVETGQPWA